MLKLDGLKQMTSSLSGQRLPLPPPSSADYSTCCRSSSPFYVFYLSLTSSQRHADHLHCLLHRRSFILTSKQLRRVWSLLKILFSSGRNEIFRGHCSLLVTNYHLKYCHQIKGVPVRALFNPLVRQRRSIWRHACHHITAASSKHFSMQAFSVKRVLSWRHKSSRWAGGATASMICL